MNALITAESMGTDARAASLLSSVVRRGRFEESMAPGDVSARAGPIPRDVGNLANLTKLWLHKNQLTGGLRPCEERVYSSRWFLCSARVLLWRSATRRSSCFRVRVDAAEIFTVLSRGEGRAGCSSLQRNCPRSPARREMGACVLCHSHRSTP